MNRAAGISVTLSVVAPSSENLGDVTKLIGVEPTNIWKQRNRKIAEAHPEFDHQEWQIQIPYMPAADFDEAINAALDLIWHARNDLLGYCNSSGSHITIHLMPHAGPDEIVYAIDNPDTLKRASALNCRIHFHLDQLR